MEAVGVKTSVDKKKFTAVPGSLFRKKKKSYPSDFHRLMRQFNDRGGELLWPEGALRSSRACSSAAAAAVLL